MTKEQKKIKELLKEIRKIILKGFGKRCTVWALGCWTCMAWRSFEELEDILLTSDTLSEHKQNK